mgnify:CR=1 FL=1
MFPPRCVFTTMHITIQTCIQSMVIMEKSLMLSNCLQSPDQQTLLKVRSTLCVRFCVQIWFSVKTLSKKLLHYYRSLVIMCCRPTFWNFRFRMNPQKSKKFLAWHTFLYTTIKMLMLFVFSCHCTKNIVIMIVGDNKKVYIYIMKEYSSGMCLIEQLCTITLNLLIYTQQK